MKYTLIAAFGFFLTIPATHAAGRGNGNEKAKQKEKEKQEQREVRDKKRTAVDEVLAAKDKNDDGSLTKDEYIAGEADAEAASKNFDKFNKNKDRALSKAEIAASLGL